MTLKQLIGTRFSSGEFEQLAMVADVYQTVRASDVIIISGAVDPRVWL